MLADAIIQDREIQPTGQPVENTSHIDERLMNPVHIPTHHNMRQATGGRQIFDILLRRLIMARRQWQRSAQELFAGASAHFEQLNGGKFFQRAPGLGQPFQILSDKAGVDLADSRSDFSGAEILHLSLFDAFITRSQPQSRDMAKRTHLVILSTCGDLSTELFYRELQELRRNRMAPARAILVLFIFLLLHQFDSFLKH